MASIVYVVDDDLSVREALASLIRSVALRVQTFASAAEFLACERAATPACLVLDVRMPGLGGLELQRELARSGREIPIVFITGHGDIPMTVRAMKAGAVDFLAKPFRDQDLLDAIAHAIELDEAALRRRAELGAVQARWNTLTAREREVARHIVRGVRNKQVAAELGISEITVKVHRHNVMEKMQAASLPALVGMVERLALG